ncbi:MAG: iron chelate uptake ABC transporter family permease subunit, partial [Clostridiales Family XIII bacterium]|nr:iron chelate uptake ABC transporter family permease subunit [Clostridiales Family XIII bacterium]
MRTGHDSGNIGSGSGGSAYRAPSSHRKKMRALGGACLLAFFLSLCIRVTIPGLVSPLRALSCLVLWMRLAISRAIGTQPWLGRFALIEAAGGPLYYDSVSRFLTTLVSFACGMLLALSGHIFQTAFKNPLAAPAILGVAAGVRVGILLVFLQYGISSLNMPLERYIYCYSAALLMLGTTLLLAKVSSGKRKFSTTDLLIVAAILSQVVSAVYSWRVFTLENDDALVLARLGNQIVTNTAPESLAALGLVLLLCIPPFFLLRFS